MSSLIEYWQDENRAEKFTSGGTRIDAVQYLLNRAEVEIHKGVWIDTAIGAGYVQAQLFKSVIPNMLVGIDISRNMLEKVGDNVERIMGSTFTLPIRKMSSNIVTNIFCLSDYPDPSKAFEEMSRICQRRGIVMYLDYSDEDGYWVNRKNQHDGKKVVGNINLRNTESIQQYLPDSLGVVGNLIIEYKVETSQFDDRVDLPELITRAFLFVELYKSRSV